MEVNLGLGLFFVDIVNTLAEERLREKLPYSERNPLIILLHEFVQDFGFINEIRMRVDVIGSKVWAHCVDFVFSKHPMRDFSVCVFLRRKGIIALLLLAVISAKLDNSLVESFCIRVLLVQQLLTLIVVTVWIVQSVSLSLKVKRNFYRFPPFNKGFHSGSFWF